MECKKECSAHPDCQFWTWSSNRCQLKNENALERRINVANAISGSANCPGNIIKMTPGLKAKNIKAPKSQ